MKEGTPSPKSRAAALALAVTIGVFGAHRFYVGRPGSGLLMLFTLGGMGIWYVYDIIVISAGSFEDAEGRRVTNWVETDPATAAGAGDPRRQELILQELDLLRGEMADLDERVDFMERMLARVKDRGAMPRGDA